MNEQWKKTRGHQYIMINNLLTPIDQLKNFKDDFEQGMNQVQGAITALSKKFNYRKMLADKNQKVKELDKASTAKIPRSRSRYSPQKQTEEDNEDDNFMNSEEEEEDHRKRVESFTDQLEQKKNKVKRKIYQRKYEQQVFAGTIKNLDDLFNKKISLFSPTGGIQQEKKNNKQSDLKINLDENQLDVFKKEVAERNHTERRKKLLANIINDNENLKNQEKWVQDLKKTVVNDMEKDRKARERRQKREKQIEDEGIGHSRHIDEQKTYPL